MLGYVHNKFTTFDEETMKRSEASLNLVEITLHGVLSGDKLNICYFSESCDS